MDFFECLSYKYRNKIHNKFDVRWSHKVLLFIKWNEMNVIVRLKEINVPFTF